MRIEVDTKRCIGAGECVIAAAAIFDQNDSDGTVVLLDENPPESLSDALEEAIELIDRQMAAPRFRGVRPMGATVGPLPEGDVLRALAERSLVFEVMAHPDQLRLAAAQLAGARRPSDGQHPRCRFARSSP